MSSSIKKCIESIYSEVGHNVMSECIMRYGLDKEECEGWMSELIAGLSASASSSSSEKAVKTKVSKVSKGNGKAVEAVAAVAAVAAEVVYPFPIPFNKNRINSNGCHGLAYNHGLFNQCIKKKLDTGNYCKNCQKESDQSGQPSCGTIEARVSEDLLDYTDPKGRKPIAYLKVLEKQKFSVDTVKEFIMRENIEVDSIHFECNEQKRGRPKSKIAKQVEAATVEDLFATLVNDDTVSVAGTEIMSDSEDEDESAAAEAVAAAEAAEAVAAAAAEAKKCELAAEKEARVSMRCEETEQKKCEKEAKAQQLAAEKEAKAQQLAAEKEAKAQQLAAEKEAKQKEKEAKLQQAAAEKEAKAKQVAAEKEAKAKQAAAEKEAKAKQAAAEKEAKLKQAAAQKEADKKLGKVPKKQAVKETIVKAPKVEEEEEQEEHVSVTSITINGTVYFISKANILYNPKTKEAVGIYDEVTKSIKELPEESDDELCEDEYESDN